MDIKQIVTDYIMKSILTAQGDMVVRGATVPEKLVAVAVGQVFKSAGENTKPAWGKPSLADLGMDSGSFSTSASEDTVISGLAFQPAIVFFLATDPTTGNLNFSVGIDNNTTQEVLAQTYNGTKTELYGTASAYIRRDAGNYITGSISALAAGGFTFTSLLTSACSMNIRWFAIG